MLTNSLYKEWKKIIGWRGGYGIGEGRSLIFQLHVYIRLG